MTARAAMTTGDLNRLLKAAKAHGFVVEFDGSTWRLLPTTPGEVPPSGDSPAQKALAKWRRSA